MKRIIVIALSLLSLAVCLPGPVRSLDISVGPVVWYAWWSPFYKDIFMGKYYGDAKLIMPLSSNTPKFSFNNHWGNSGSFLLGPALSVKLSKGWSVSSVFTAAVPYDQRGGFYQITTGSPVSYENTDYKLKTKKYDLDTTLSYSVIPQLKFFGGFKYQGYSINGKKRELSTGGSESFERLESNSNGYGAGAGIGTTLPMYENLYLLGNASGIYLNTRNLLDEKTFSAGGSNSFTRSKNIQFYNAYGFSGSLALAYYVAAASVTVSAGARFQVLKYYCTSSIVDMRATNIMSLNDKISFDKIGSHVTMSTTQGQPDYFYGATLSVTYTFQI